MGSEMCIRDSTCPEDDKTYVHRIGRTGRAGASGIAITFVDWADLHRWKMINKALSLPFEELVETYSTSEHLYHEQGIAPDTKGRIVDAAPVERKPRTDSDRRSGGRSNDRSGGRSDGRSGGRDGGREAAPAAEGTGDAPRRRNRSRSRSRTRGGETVAKSTD